MSSAWRVTLVLCLLSAYLSEVVAQEIPIDIQKALKLAGAQNHTIERLDLQQQLAAADVAIAQDWWLPELYLGGAIDQRWGATMNGDGRFFTDVNNKNFWGGLGLNVAWDLADGIYVSDAQQLRSEASAKLSQAGRNQILLSVVETYYQFLNSQLMQEAYKSLADQSDSMSIQIKGQVDAGLMYESDLLIAESNKRHLRSQVLDASMDAAIAEAELIQLLDLPFDSSLRCVDLILAPVTLSSTEDTLDSYYNSRKEYQAAEILIKASQKERKVLTTGLLLPEIRIGTFTSEFGDVFSPLYTTSGLNASVMWRIPLGRFTYKGGLKIIDTEILLAENAKDDLRSEIDQESRLALELLEISSRQIELSKESVEYAREGLSQAIQRQNIGLVVPYEMIQMQGTYLQSRLDQLRAISSYNINSYKLFIARGGDL